MLYVIDDVAQETMHNILADEQGRRWVKMLIWTLPSQFLSYLYIIGLIKDGMMNVSMRALGVAIALLALAVINARGLGYCIKEVGDPQPTLNFLFKLIFNRWFILAVASAFIAALLSYVVLKVLPISGIVTTNWQPP